MKIYFFLSWDYVLNDHHAIGYHSCLYDFLIAVAIIIARHGEKTLHWLLSKVILSGMCNSSFEAIKYNLGQNI